MAATPTPTLAYRSPTTPDAGRDRLAMLIRQHDALSTGKAVGLVVGGLAILLVMLSLVAGGIVGILQRLEVPVSPWIVWVVVLFGLGALLFWVERRYRGQFYESQAEGGGFGGGSATASSYGEFEMQGHMAYAAAVVEFFLLGPNLTLEGLGMRRRRGKIDDKRLGRVAEVVRDLLLAGEGVRLGKLLRPGEPPAELKAAIAYLIEHEWIGQSRDRSRVWLLSDAKRYLEERGAV